MPVDSNYVPIPAGAGNTVVFGKGGARLGKIEVIGPVGAGTVTLYDNATTNSGNILAVVPASAPIGYEIVIEIQVTNGIVATGSTSSPACNVTYST